MAAPPTKEASDTPAGSPTSKGLVRSVLNLDSLIYVYGAWTIGYWIALALGLGWYFALGFFVLVGACLISFLRRWRAPQFDTSTERADVGPLAVILAVVLVWPMAQEGLGRTTLVVIALFMLALRGALPIVDQRFERRDARLFVLGAIALAATLAFLVSWTAFAVLLCAFTLAAMSRSRFSSWLSESFGKCAAGSRRDRGQQLSRFGLFSPRRVSTMILGGLGVLIAVWRVGLGFWSDDNTYYLNKAAHFAASPTSFPVRDYMFGIAGATHYPYGDILSAFEPLLGTASAVSGVSVSRLLFQLMVPLSMLLVPFAARYAARGLELRRANLVGGFAAASVLVMTAVANTSSLFGTASFGKTVGQLVGVPLVIGATGALLKRRDPGAAVRAMLAWVCAVGLSPSLAVAALLIVAPFTAAGLWGVWQRRTDGSKSQLPSLFWLSLPCLSLAAFSLFALVMSRNAGSSQLLYGYRSQHPQQAWEYSLIGLGARPVVTLLFLVGSTALLPLVVDATYARRAVGLLILVLFGAVLAPWSFNLIVNRLLDVNYFAPRFLWALPPGLLIGIALAHIDARRTLGLLTVVAAVMGLGLSGPDNSSFLFNSAADVRHAPVWPWQAGIPTGLRRSAESVVDATPDGGRFLAPPTIEEVATAIQIGRFPVYARVVYALAIGRANSVPDDFFPQDRVFLGQAMEGKSPRVDADGWRQALARVNVATVCIDRKTAAGLRQVVTESYVPAGSAGLCELWSRPRA